MTTTKRPAMPHPPRFVSLILVAAFLIWLVPAAVPAAAAIPPGFPTSETTGPTNPSLLQVHEGDMTVTQSGAIVENLEIRGQLTIQASNVTVRNVWIYNDGGFYTILVDSGSALIQDVEIGHPDHLAERGVSGDNLTVLRADIHHVEDGIKIASNVVYDSVYVHDLDSPNSAPHSDGMQAEGGETNVIVRNSTLDARRPDGVAANAAIIIKSDFGPISNITVENTYLNGGNYTVYSRTGGSGNPTNIVFRNNVFGLDERFGLLSVDGTITFTGNRLVDGRVLDSSGQASGGSFTDDNGSIHEADINALAAAGITTGCAPGKYCPNANVTRAEIAVLLIRALDESPSSAASSFSDVAPGIWYAGSVQRLVELEVLLGCAPGRFCPNSSLSRAELAAVLVRSLGLTGGSGSDFGDVPASAWYAAFAGALREAGITEGCSVSPLMFCPNSLVTRGQVASFLVRGFDL